MSTGWLQLLVKITLRAAPVMEQTVGVESAMAAQLPPLPSESLEDPHAASTSEEVIRMPMSLFVTTSS
jgi:hypothetical protein